MTYVFTKISGLPENQILGSGTMLDSARLRCGLSEHLNIAQKNIHAYVFGEHGDTSFIPWSGAYVSGVSLDEYYETVEKMGRNVTKIDKDAMLEYVRTSGGQVIANKGATFYAVSASVCKLCSIPISSSDSITPVSSMLKHTDPRWTERRTGQDSDAYDKRGSRKTQSKCRRIKSSYRTDRALRAGNKLKT